MHDGVTLARNSWPSHCNRSVVVDATGSSSSRHAGRLQRRELAAIELQLTAKFHGRSSTGLTRIRVLEAANHVHGATFMMLGGRNSRGLSTLGRLALIVNDIDAATALAGHEIVEIDRKGVRCSCFIHRHSCWCVAKTCARETEGAR